MLVVHPQGQGAGAGFELARQVHVPVEAVVVVPVHGAPLPVGGQVAVDVEPGLAEEAGKVDAEIALRVGGAHLDFGAVPDEAVVLASAGALDPLGLHVEIGAQRPPLRQVQLRPAPGLVQAGVVGIGAEAPGQGKPLHQSAGGSVGEGEQIPVLLHLSRPPGVALLQAGRGEGGAHAGQGVAPGQTPLPRAHGGAVVGSRGGPVDHLHVGLQDAVPGLDEAHPAHEEILRGPVAHQCAGRSHVRSQAAHQLRRVDHGGEPELVLVGEGALPGLLDRLPVGAHGGGRRPPEAGVELLHLGLHVGVGIPVEEGPQVEVEEGGGQRPPALGVDPEDAGVAVVAHVLADRLHRGVGDVAPDQHALVVVVDDEAALHRLRPAVHDLSVLLAGRTAGIVHAVDGADVDRRQVGHQGLGGGDPALGRQGDVGVGEEADAPAREAGVGQLGDAVVEGHEGIGEGRGHEVLVPQAGGELLVGVAGEVVEPVVHAQGDGRGALGEAFHHLVGHVADGGRVGEADRLGRIAGAGQVVHVVAEGVAGGHGQVVHPVAAHELLPAAVVADPGEPVAPHLEGRSPGRLEAVQGQRRLSGDAVAEIGGQVPAAAPVPQQFHCGVVVGLVVASGQVDPVPPALRHDGVAAQDGVGLLQRRQAGSQGEIGLEGGPAYQQQGSGFCQGLLELGGVLDEGQPSAAHLLDVTHEVLGGAPFPLPRLGVHADTGPAVSFLDHDEGGGRQGRGEPQQAQNRCVSHSISSSKAAAEPRSGVDPPAGKGYPSAALSPPRPPSR